MSEQQENGGAMAANGIDTNASYDDNIKKFVEMMKDVTHAKEIQIYTGELMQIYRESRSQLNLQLQSKIHKAIEKSIL